MSFINNDSKRMIAAALGDEAVEAVSRLYSLYTPEMIDWFAGLYDPNHGGYYYSNSARDNSTVVSKGKVYDLLPDAESTCQALGFFESSGMLKGTGKRYADVLPAWMKEQILDFMSGLQDPDGYFYHPQWGKAIGTSRRARDFNWCRSVISNLGGKLRYPTILDNPKGDGGETLVPEHLATLESFKKYVDGLDLPSQSYVGGNLLSCQAVQIKSCGYLDWLIGRLNELQHSDTGLWHYEPSYYGVNGLMKIAGVYNSARLPLPNAIAAADSALNALASDEACSAVVNLWNTWVAVSRIATSQREYGGDEGVRIAEEITCRVRARAAELIDRSVEKLSPFAKDDGGFSYNPHRSAPWSQGMPVAIPETPEGDVNATVIASSLMANSIFSAMDLSRLLPPVFGESELTRYLEILEKRNGN